MLQHELAGADARDDDDPPPVLAEGEPRPPIRRQVGAERLGRLGESLAVLDKTLGQSARRSARISLLFDTCVFIVSVIAMIAIMANYYLLEKYDASFVTPIAESALLIFNAIFSVVLLGEKITMDMITGIGLIISGIMFIYRKQMKLF